MDPVSLDGLRVRLEPLTKAHVPQLSAIGLAPSLWQWQPKAIETVLDMRKYVLRALQNQTNGTELPFVIVDLKSGDVMGSTRFMDISPQNRRLEIGATWLGLEFQKSFANTEIKLLMLTHAFESLKSIKVVFKTERLNERSRTALKRIGAVEEGILRSHLLREDGRSRDMVYFSILDSEWSTVKQQLLKRYSRLIE